MRSYQLHWYSTMSYMTSVLATLLWEPHITHELNFQCSKEHHVPFIRDWCGAQCTYHSDVDSGCFQNKRSLFYPYLTDCQRRQHCIQASLLTLQICYSLSVCIMYFTLQGGLISCITFLMLWWRQVIASSLLGVKPKPVTLLCKYGSKVQLLFWPCKRKSLK